MNINLCERDRALFTGAALLLLFPGFARASTYNRVSVDAELPYLGGSDQSQWRQSFVQVDQSGDVLLVADRGGSGTTDGRHWVGNATAIGMAAGKRLRVASDAQRTNYTSAFANAQATIEYSLRMDSNIAPPGEVLEFAFGVRANGNLSGFATPSAEHEAGVDFVVTVDNILYLHLEGWVSKISGDQPFPYGNHYVTVPVQNHHEVLVRMQALASAAADCFADNTVANASADFGHSFEWLGVTDVRDSAGNPIADYSLTDDVGRDWAVGPPPVGDMNCDGSVDSLDVSGFVLAMIDRTAYATQYPTCFVNGADLNYDARLNGLDIAGFVQLLSD